MVWLEGGGAPRGVSSTVTSYDRWANRGALSFTSTRRTNSVPVPEGDVFGQIYALLFVYKDLYFWYAHCSAMQPYSTIIEVACKSSSLCVGVMQETLF